MNAPEVVDGKKRVLGLCTYEQQPHVWDPNCHDWKPISTPTPEPAGEPLAEVVLPDLEISLEDQSAAFNECYTPNTYISGAVIRAAYHCRTRQLLSSLRTIEQLREQLKAAK